MGNRLENLFRQAASSGRPLVIAGPCSAESRSQVLETSRSLSGMADVFRAGIWKPRTKPGGFEGVGADALDWLSEAGRSAGVPVCTEVATPEHLRLALDAGVEILWIGARTTADPFAVQALADAVREEISDRGKEISLLIKNPVNPDVELWAGALERFRNAGVKDLALVHRGFSSYGSGLYRNIPLWHLPIEMKRRFPNVPLVCDPSHMGGRRELIFPLCQQALDLIYDGLMIESHVNPEEALSDKGQQISPLQLKDILGRLVVRRNRDEKGTADPYGTDVIDAYRRRIDELDENLMHILAERMEVSGRIGQYKEEHNMPVLQSRRYGQIIEDRKQLAMSLGLDTEFAKSLMELIHKESVRLQLIQRNGEDV